MFSPILLDYYIYAFGTKGKKTGYWKVFLDEKIDPIKNIEDSYFYCFELWDEGERIFAFFKHSEKNDTLIFNGILPTKGTPLPLSGVFKWFNKKNNLLNTEEIYENGKPFLLKYFYNPINKTDTILTLFEELDFSKRYNNISGTFLYQVHYYNKVKKYWYKKGKRSWRSYRIKEE
jgi:hypothetical protein